MALPDYLPEIKTFLLARGVPETPEAAIILGSGLGGFTETIEGASSISYSSVPRFPIPSVAGHEGELISGTINGHNVIAFSGRFHHYEGFSFEQTALPVYLAKSLETRKLILTNAAGAINTSFSVGDLMVIEDLMRQNMAISPWGNARFRYSHHQWTGLIRELAANIGISTQQGTYIYVKGPNYETRAEIRAFRTMGADAVGMSTAPELTEAARLDIKTAAISVISNMAAGVTGEKISHDEVAEAAGFRNEDFGKLVKQLVEEF